jgi:4-amino-4-deoxy-L-arabinose transferase-like glycosyltransferase
MPFMHRFAFALTLIAICLASFILSVNLAGQVFEYVPHSEDEVAYLFQAKVLALNQLAVPTPPYEQAFWTPFVVDYQGQRFGKYPPGWPFLLSFGVRLDAPWLVNALLGALTLALIAWLGRCCYGVKTGPADAGLAEQNQLSSNLPHRHLQLGLWAAGLALVTPGFLVLSSSLLSHAASLFWTALALVGLYYSTKPGSYGVGSDRKGTGHSPAVRYKMLYVPYLDAFVTGLACGAIFITRPFAGVGIGLALGFFLLLLSMRQEIKWTVFWWVTLGGLPVALLLSTYWWAITGHPLFNAYLLVWPYDRVGLGPDIGPYGYTLSDAILINTRLKLTALATGLFGWPGWSNLIFLPLPFLARRANRWDWLLLATLVSLTLVHLFYWSFGGTDGGFPRYYYEALPALLLLTVRGIQIAVDYLASWSANFQLDRYNSGKAVRSYLPLHWLPLVLVIIFTLYNLLWNLPLRLADQKGKYGITSAQLQVVEQANLTEPALVIVKNVDQWSDFAAPFAANSPLLEGPVLYAIDWGPDFNHKLQRYFRERHCWELVGEQLRPCP